MPDIDNLKGGQLLAQFMVNSYFEQSFKAERVMELGCPSWMAMDKMDLSEAHYQ